MEFLPIRCRIPELEETNNLEPYQVYETIGMTKQQYSAYRNGRILPHLTNAKRLAEFFEVPIDELHEWPEIKFLPVRVRHKTE